ncbi:uncharacterized protein LOC131853727 [Achroia grisella]|uniref:uncharacterized protein LOC131853727 n=1 Tax=Achroia grisella TaxID=688607 RepID=UPI0027D3116F|nr:uncharacterized protein LOC131853727 [Achroia grisella]
MDILKRKRTQFRREFTILSDAIEKAFEAKDSETIDEKYTTLTDSVESLFECEAAIRNLWCEDDNFDEQSFQADQDKTLEYREKWSKIRTKYTKYIKRSDPLQCSSNHSIVSAETMVKSHNNQCNNKQRLLIPKLEIIKFDGNVKSWLLFWGQFQKVHDDKEINDSDKFQYLLQSMATNSSARQLVESYPPCAANYPKAIDALKTRFARDDVLIETYVRGLLTLMQDKNQLSNSSDLPALYDKLQTHLQALETLGVTKDKYASILFPMVESVLPEEILRAWNRHRSDNNKGLSELVEFLRQEVESEERIQLARQGFTLTPTTSSEPKSPTICFMSETKTQTKEKRKRSIICIWCDRDSHGSSECYKAARMTLKERKEFVKSKKACPICLTNNHHFMKRCKSFPKCLFCKKRHFTIMCPDIDEQGQKKKEICENEANNLLCQLKPTTLLQTVVVVIKSGNKKIPVRALIDSGAQRSYIKKDIVRKLNLKSTRKERITHCLFGGIETKTEERDVFDISVDSVTNDFSLNLSVLEQDNICGFLPKIRSSVIIEQLRDKGIILTDKVDSPDDVCLLFGADFSGALLTGDIIHLENLTAIKTKLGWTIQGPTTGIYSSVVTMTTTLHCLTKIDISDLWTLETLGITDPVEQSNKTQQELKVLQSFQKSVKINEEGRYEVCLPWRDVPRPSANFEVARKRLDSTMKKLLQLGKVEQYDTVFREWLALNIIEVAPNQDVKGHYMPHHAVIKESSLTTKIRPVFDASAKDKCGISLNSCLEKGVNLLEQIPQLMLNFRKEAIGVTADIAKAFLQISIVPDDRDYLRFLWWSHPSNMDKTIVTYRHRRVVFGVASSPFHLIATINHHLDHCHDHLKQTAEQLKNSFYVDNCVTSLPSKAALDKFINESKELMINGKFDLRGWVSSPILVDNKVENISILGVLWNINGDNLRCNCNSLKNIDEKITKRSLLSITQRVFDPIGIVCPTTIIPKMIIQAAWTYKLTWDEELPQNLAKDFKTWLSQAHLINECVIPRRLTSSPINESKNSLHVFCDASNNAYSACIFLRADYNGKIDVRLVMAKARVTPLKKITIPRLELIAATLATRLAATVTKTLALQNCPVWYWTDSSVVLTWIKGDGDWSIFVKNRVKEIKNSSSSTAWRHVPGDSNPADLPSRGINPKRLLESKWWEGPAFLLLDEEDWPNEKFGIDYKEVNQERKKHCIQSMLIEEELFLEKLRYFSNYIKIVRMIGWMLRIKRKPKTTDLTYEEYENAERKLIRIIQSRYKDNINMKNLLLFTDDNGLLRLKTKIDKGTERYDFKYPIILPSEEPIVQRMVQQRHITLQHAGVQSLMCNLRETFWIIGLRKITRKVVSNCIRCKRFKAKSCYVPTGSLPTDRMEANMAFETTGVDLAGPLMLRSESKVWIVLFTCATYRAVHLELVESLSTRDFIMALRRFTARRGRVKTIYSDNGTNFRGLDNSFNTLDWNEILQFSTITRIKWKFLPPSAPWWGGFYERLIGTLKQILRRVLGRASLSFVELQTILCDCEATINNRPLTYISNSQDELRALTPSMFIQPQAQCEVRDLDEIDSKSLNVRAKHCQNIRDAFRQRFRKEYISTLIQPRNKKYAQLQCGDVVLIETEDNRRINWPLGIVEELYDGTDQFSRVAKVRTATGDRVRPVQRLFPLEIRHNVTNNHDSDTSNGTMTEQDMTEEVHDNTDSTTRVLRSRSGRELRPPRYLNDFTC